MTKLQTKILLRALLYSSIGFSILNAQGCADKNKELEPRTDTRPMVNAIQQAEQDWSWITGQEWHLFLIEGHAPIAGTNIQLQLKEHTWLDGNAGCNRYTANYIRKADAGLKFSDILTTRMYCAEPQGVMQQEARYIQLLQQVDAYHAERTQINLYADGAVILSFMILEAEEKDRSEIP